MTILLISPCHYQFGGWYRANNISTHLKHLKYKVYFIYPLSIVNNLWKRVINGIINCKYIIVGNYDIIHIFEIVQPETLFPALLARLLRKRIIVDVGDEWLYSPTYVHSNPIVRLLIYIIDIYILFLFPDLTLTSNYLKNKYNRGLILINGVNKEEFEPVHRNQARKELKIGYDTKILLAFGNTWGNQRSRLLMETYEWIKTFDKDIKLFIGTGWDKKKLALFLGACNLVVFPTGGEPCERACFPIRVGSCLNAERVIATDTSDTEFHSTLHNCLLVGRNPEEIAVNIIRFFEERNYRKNLEENVRKTREELDWSKLILKLDAFYRQNHS